MITCLTPKYRKQKAKPHARAFVDLGGKRHYLGRYGTSESRRKYEQTVAEWLEAGRQQRVQPNDITIVELIARFWEHALAYYRMPNGKLSSTITKYQMAFSVLKEVYGRIKAIEFGPVRLKVIRQKMIERGWCRRTVNQHVGLIRAMFRWGVAEQLVPVEILQALSTLAPLRKGRCGAPDHGPVQPVSDKHIEKAKQHVAPQVAAIIDLQLLTGARAGELVMMRPVDLNMNGKVWTYTPHEHKTAHHGHTRTIYIGPRGQDVIRPFLSGRPVDRFLFSPQEAEKQRLVLAHTSRKTPLSCGNRPGTNRVRQPQRKPRERYDVDSYRRAIQRGCDKAGTSRWHPHQLRHNAGTTVRKLEGIEVARIILGHRSAQITETYAELDHQRAIEVMAEIG